ncbi:MAG TPA: serpin family protein [Firmicutes bacterium]|nr:serpin family protein [Bacillota bacterium]
MKRFHAAAMLALLMILSAGGCNLPALQEGEAAPAEELDERLVEANNNFGFSLLKKLQKGDRENNLLISPASIMTALAMTLNGAEAETRTEMENTLHLAGMSGEEINEAFAGLLTILHNPDPEVELALANSLWAREDVEFKETFINQNRNFYDAEISVLDFSDPDAAALINEWIREKTGQKIDGIVEPPVNPDTILFLINALYFKGAWSEPFNPDQTREISFNLPDGTTMEHPVMFRTGLFEYLETDLFQAVRLPYGENERIAMTVFLPSGEINPGQFISGLNIDNWKEWNKAFRSMEGDLGLPRFGFTSEMSLNDVLSDLGMKIAFDENAADFSGMHPTPPRLFISEVKHKTYIDVNEEGTEAAAVTSVEVEVTAMPERFSMVIDRPFFFTITDEMTGAILFMGTVFEP